MEEYQQYIKHLITLMDDKCPWPAELILDPAKQPTILTSADDFVDEMRRGNYLDRIVVLPNGTKALDYEATDILTDSWHQAVSNADSADQVLASLAASGDLAKLKGNMYVPSDEPGMDDSIEGKDKQPGLEAKWERLQEEPKDIQRSVYVSEVRKMNRYRRNNRWMKSVLNCTMRERVGTDEMTFWDDYSQGLFIGQHGTAYNLHADQVQTSNVGSQWWGHKLLAIWQYPDVTKEVLEEHFRSVFAPPLQPYQRELLQKACCIAIVPPGAVWIFSGANAHVTCNLGYRTITLGDNTITPSLCVNSYEAFVGMNPAIVQAMVNTNKHPNHWEGCWMEEDEMEDFKSDVHALVKQMVAKLSSGSFRTASIPMACNAVKMCYGWIHEDDSEEEAAQHRKEKQLALRSAVEAIYGANLHLALEDMKALLAAHNTRSPKVTDGWDMWPQIESKVKKQKTEGEDDMSDEGAEAMDHSGHTPEKMTRAASQVSIEC